ncbi:COX15/CtaA family protein [Brevibacillus ginsengisoli]|uniref:COX15/CtaA family protein n=1 Tax=Brevibacillus ginsengisoli TaxID=363854 RepID=UPI003CFB039F
MDKFIKWLAIAATVIMFMVMIAGSLVTNTNSGMGCGNDWPLCNGKWVPEYTLTSIIEYMHRIITGLAGMVVIAFSVLAWRHYRGNKEVRSLAMFGTGFIIVESIMGASAVIWPQSDSALALHFGFSLLAFTGVLLLSIFVLQRSRSKRLVQTEVSRGFRNFAWLTAVFAYGVVYLGAYVRHTKSYLACPDFPLCQGKLIPDLTGQVANHFAHRAGAFVLTLLILGMMTYAIRHYKETRRDIYTASILAFVLVLMQGLSGAILIWTQINLYSTILHSAVVTCLFGTLCYICWQTLKKPEK